MDENTSYTLHFMVDVCDNDIGTQLQELTTNGTVLSVLVPTDTSMVCLVKGPVTQQEASLQHGGAGSTIQVQGEDLGYLMDVGHEVRITSTGTDADIARSIISRQSAMIPDVAPTPDSAHTEENHSHAQTQTDLELIRTLARRNGYHFWITCNELGVATGHFKPRSLDGEAEAELIVNHENNNIDALRIVADSRRPTRTSGNQINPRTLEPMAQEATLSETNLGETGLAQAAGSNARTLHLSPTVDDAGAMQRRSESALRDAQWFINATCSTGLHRLCKIVRFHTIVKVTGAGSRHSGKYYVTAVRHNIDAVAYQMDLELSRNAWGNSSSSPTGLPPGPF